ncbi:MAG: NADH-quinone oxidoreductase subunit B family protein [Candidatus Bathyarchaeia archaeon]
MERIKLTKMVINWFRKKSPWVFHLNTGSCNNCDIEIIETLTSRFDVERFGITLEGSPRHADIFLVTGIVTRQTISRLKRIYEQAPNPKVVVAIGECAASGGIFRESYHMAGPLDKVIPVDVYVLGCPPRPQAIIDGVIKALEIFEKPSIEYNSIVIS